MAQDPNWKDKFQDIVSICQEEFKRTTLIGKRMINASKTNTLLKESYEDLGVALYKALSSGEHQWENEEVSKLVETIQNCENDLETIEKEVQDIKKESNLDNVD